MARYEYVQRHVTEARYLGDYKIWLEFNDGRKGVVDLADDLYQLGSLAVTLADLVGNGAYLHRIGSDDAELHGKSDRWAEREPVDA